MIEVDIFAEGTADLPFHDADSDFLKNIAVKTLEYQKENNVSAAIIVTDNEEIKKINSEYRGKDSPTDVISFVSRDEPFPGPADETENLGDIYISLEKAYEQSIEYEVSVRDELKRLVIHGILHLLGFDHEKSEDEEKIMSDLEEKIFDCI